jgi:hypothetical protein
VGFGFLPAVIYFSNVAVFLWAFPVKPDTIGAGRGAAIKPLRSRFRRSDMKSKKGRKTTKRSKNGKKTSGAAPAAKSQKPGADAKRTIKQVVIETLAANSSATNDEMIAAVKKEFPRSAFKATHAAWYRSQARKGSLTGTLIAIPVMGRKRSKAAD